MRGIGVWVAVLVSAMLSLGAAELGARLLGNTPAPKIAVPRPWAVADSVIGWRNHEGTFESPLAPMTFWSGGRRASAPRPPSGDKPRAIIVGDSFTQGYDLVDSETYAWKLNERDLPYFFDNYGTGGYSGYQALLLLEELFKDPANRPDLVIYGFCQFHEDRNVGDYQWYRGLNSSSAFRLPYVELDGSGRLQRRESARLTEWPLYNASALVHMAVRAHDRWRHGRIGQSREATAQLLVEMNRVVSSHGAKLLIANIYDYLPDRFYLKRMEADGLTFIDCNRPEPDWYYYNPELKVNGRGHPNGVVNTSWADCIANWVRAHPPAGR